MGVYPACMARSFRPDLMRLARKQRRMSQPELARLLSDIEGVSCSLATVKRWESGKTEPRIKDAEAIARVLGVSINYLTGWGGRKE